MSYFNLSNASNMTEIGTLFTFTNEVTSGVYGLIMMMIIFTVFFFWLKTYYPTERCFASASFVSLVLSLLFMPFGLAVFVFYFFLACSIVGIFLLMKGD